MVATTLVLYLNCIEDLISSGPQTAQLIIIGGISLAMIGIGIHSAGHCH